MRLIDADKLLRFFTVDTANQTYRFGTIKKQIENAETVQAIIIPDNATNGDMIKVMFPNQTISCAIPITDRNGAKFYRTTINGVTDFTEDWWNAPYTEKRGNKVGWSSLENVREKVERGNEND